MGASPMEDLLRGLRERIEKLERRQRLPIGEGWRLEQDDAGDIVVVNSAGDSFPLNREPSNGVIGADGRDGKDGATGPTGAVGPSSGVAWGFSGPVMLSSHLVQRAPAGTIINLVASLVVAATTNTVVTFYKNGVSMGTATILAGAMYGFTPVTVTTVLNDALSAVITTAGAGGSDLSAQAMY